MAPLSATDIATLCLHNEKYLSGQVHQTEHRIALWSKWNVDWEGAKVLEIGCGQGDFTAVLAEAVGPNGHVTAVDPGPLTYGSPFTLGQAQSHLSSGRLGSRITWKQADPRQLLAEDSQTYDIAVVANCLWYFFSPAEIAETLHLLATRTRKVCIAEWSLSATNPGSSTHVLAVLAQTALESHKEKPESNVRTVVSPTQIKELAMASGLRLESEDMVTPAGTVQDGRWETYEVVSDSLVSKIKEVVKEERDRTVVLALRDATLASLAKLEGGMKSVQSMDVWVSQWTTA